MCIRDSRPQAHRLGGTRAAGGRGPAQRRERPARRGRAARCSQRLFREACRMSRGNELHDAVRRQLERYFKDMDGEKPTSIYDMVLKLSLIHISEPTRLLSISYAV